MFEKKTSEKKIAANRENAKKSTGPTSPEGKKTSSVNGFRHGFTGTVFIETDEDYKAHRNFTKQYLAELAPEGFVETDLANAAADTAWRLNRMRAHENNYFSLRLGADGDQIETPHAQVHTALTHANVVFDHSKELCNIALYEQRLSRLLHKNLQVLKEMKKSRSSQMPEEKPKVMTATQSGPDTQVAEAAQTAVIKHQTPEESITFPENGFGFSNREALGKQDPQPAAPAVKDAA